MQKITTHTNELDAKVNVFLKKTALQNVYESFYEKIYEHCNEFGKTLEIGSASGKSRNSFKNIFPRQLSAGHTHLYTKESLNYLAKKNGALGGKISGAGGGGFFTFYCEEDHDKLRTVMLSQGLRELKFDFDFEGTKVLANFMSYRPSDL